MDLIPLTVDYELKPFDCGDADLNGFLLNDAKSFLQKKLARTLLLVDEDEIAAYFCLFNDKISKQDVADNSWRKIKKLFPLKKHFSSYPAIKIGRSAVSLSYRHSGIGSELMRINIHG